MSLTTGELITSLNLVANGVLPFDGSTCDLLRKAAGRLESQQARIAQLVSSSQLVGTVPANPPMGVASRRFLIGQRVILNGFEIGTVCAPQNKDLPNTDTEVWVHSPSRGHASRYAAHNIKPLPGGQL